MALVALAVVFSLRANRGVTWMIHLAIPLAALLGWRLSWHLFMYPIMEYGGSYSSVEQLRTAQRRYRIGAVALAAAAMAAVVGLWRLFGW